MGLVSHALAFGLGYALARPGGREQVMQLRRQVAQLAEKPEVQRLAERGKVLAAEKARAAKQAVGARANARKKQTAVGGPANAGQPVAPPPPPAPGTHQPPPRPPESELPHPPAPPQPQSPTPGRSGPT